MRVLLIFFDSDQKFSQKLHPDLMVHELHFRADYYGNCFHYILLIYRYVLIYDQDHVFTILFLSHSIHNDHLSVLTIQFPNNDQSK